MGLRMGFVNIEQFNKEINNYAKRLLPAQFKKFFLLIGFDALRMIVMNTPVGNTALWKKPPPAGSGYTGGRARGNWLVSINEHSEQEVQREDGEGDSTISEGEQIMQGVRPGDVINITNNVPYIVALEEGHSSVQAPQGMVALAFEVLRQKYGEA